MRVTNVTVSGSFRRHMDQIQDDVETFINLGATVLSPADPRVVDAFGDFVFVASDRLRTVKTVQDRHLQAILQSDFLWLVAPDGYVGASAALELGFAMAHGIPVYSATPLTDLTMRQYVDVVPSIDKLLADRKTPEATEACAGWHDISLLDPLSAASVAHQEVDAIAALLRRRGTHEERDLELSEHAARLRRTVSGI